MPRMPRQPLKVVAADSADGAAARDRELLRLEALYCSHGDTVHYCEPPKLFERCEGSYLYDAEGREYLDLQMWYSAVNFDYRNRRLNQSAKDQLDPLPQPDRQYLHTQKIQLDAM